MTAKSSWLATSVLALAFAAAAGAAPFDARKYADTRTIDVISTDEGGGSRITTIWIVVIEDQAYIRTGSTTWGDNVERAGRLKLHDVNGDRPLRAERVHGASEIGRVEAAFHDKYGTSDTLSGYIRFGETRIFRLVGE